MSCLIVKVGSKPNHPDGQVLYAASHRRVMQVHAQHACHLDLCGYTQSGRRPIDSLAWWMWELTSQFTTSRVSRTEIVRHNKWSGEVEMFGPLPKQVRPNKWESIDVPLYISRRLRHRRHRIFGLEGNEIWHGGRSDLSEQTLQAVWEKITSRTGMVCPHWWPAGRLDLKHHLVLPLSHQLTDEESAELTGKVIDWRAMVPPLLIPLIQDRDRTVNLYRRGFYAVLNPASRLIKSFDGRYASPLLVSEAA